MCGVGAWYLDLGRFYDGQTLDQARETLLDAKERNAACYPLCTAALQCARAAADGMLAIVRQALPPAVLPEAIERLTPAFPAKSGKAPAVLHRFLRSVTPKGLLQQTPACRQLVILRDSYGVSAPLMAAIRDRALDSGYSVVSCHDPMSPGQLQALLLPELELGYMTVSKLFPQASQTPVRMDFDALTAACLNAEAEQRLRNLESLRTSAMQEALTWLAKAKQAHDELEQAYRPAVDFSGVSETASAVVRALERRLQ